jgi:hypothetical protein
MRKLLLYEAFTAKSIVKTIGFLKKNVGDEGTQEFISALKDMRTAFDISIDKIDDQYMDYMGKKDALAISGKTDDPEDKEGIFCLKFWFSTELGFLGYTGTGNTEFKFNDPELIIRLKQNGIPTPSILESIGIKSGVVTPLGDDDDMFQDLKTGDTIVGYFDEDRKDSRFSKATIFVDKRHDDRIFVYAIQDVTDGNTPENEGWEQYGSYGHVIYTYNRGKRDDCRDICLYTNDDSPLKLGNEILGDDANNPLKHNLPFDKYKHITDWNVESHRSMSTAKLKKADFAIILYVNDLKKSDLVKPSTVMSYREKSKEGASRLLTNDEYRAINLQRYVEHIAKSIGISAKDINFKNLEKLPKSLLAGKFALVALKGTDVIRKLNSFIDSTNNLFKTYKAYQESGGEVDLDYYFDDFKRLYFSVMRDNNHHRYDVNYNECIRVLDESGHRNTERVKGLLAKIISIGEMIQQYIGSEPITTPTHLKMLKFKLDNIRDVSTTDEFGIDGRLDYWIDHLHYADSDSPVSDAERLLNHSDEQLQTYEENLDNLSTYIRSLT